MVYVQFYDLFLSANFNTKMNEKPFLIKTHYKSKKTLKGKQLKYYTFYFFLKAKLEFIKKKRQSDAFFIHDHDNIYYI
jgi:hypothetical protein